MPNPSAPAAPRRTILITGCSSGIGLDAARRLRAEGWEVFASCRQEADCERLRAEGFASPRLDYTDTASIEGALAEVLAATGGRLDALYNNGAYAIPGAVEDLPTDALRAIFESNLFGWHELTRRVIPVMRAQPEGGRIVNCSSVLGFMPMAWRGAYVASKFALEGLTHVLRLEMRDTKIRLITLQPGPITSEFRANARKNFERWINWEASPRAEQYRNSLLKRLYAAGTKPDTFELPASAVSDALVRALTSRNPAPEYRITFPTKAMSLLNRVAPRRLIDAIVSRG